MFSGTAFPRIPFSGSSEIVEPKETTKPDEYTTPPVIPFNALLLVSEEARGTPTTNSGAVEPWQTRIVDEYTAVVPGIETEDAREFLAALCFLATRSNQKH